MARTLGWAALITLIVVLLGWWWVTRPPELELTPVPPATETPLPSQEPSQPQVQYPVPAVPTEKPLPPLDKSDETLRDALKGLGAEPTWLEKAVFEDFVRRVVATVDSLTTPKIPLRLLPVKPVPGKFQTATDLDGIRIAAENEARYAPYMRVLESIDSRRLVALYVRYYPLFQQAYEELGYPKGYFNDRLIAVIDHLLATPSVQEPVRLVQPKVMYQFADPELEARSCGQKILLRIGNANAAAVKEKLRAIRRALVASPPAPPA